jgi:hypothetical protein
MPADGDAPSWGAATPIWLRMVVRANGPLRIALEECLSEQAHPTDMNLWPQVSVIMNRLTWEELEALVDQGRL